MKHINTSIILLFLFLPIALSAAHTKQMPSAEQKLQVFQDLRAENHMSEHQYQHKTHRLKAQLNKNTVATKGGGTAQISGQVFSGGVAVSGVRVNLNKYYYSGTFESQYTSASGTFAFTNLNADDYFLTISNSLDDFVDAVWTSTGTQFIQCSVGLESKITLATGEISGGHDFNLTVGATLTGQIVDNVTSDPVETLDISIVKPGDPRCQFLTSTVFDGAGNYTVKGIPGGTYRVFLETGFDANFHIPEIYGDVQCNLCDLLAYNGSGSPVSLTNGVTKSGIDFSLVKGAQIEGRLIDEITSAPLDSDGLVYVFNETNQFIAVGLVIGTNANPTSTGSYKIGGLLPGTYFVQGGDGGNEFYIRELYADKPCPWSGCDRGGGGTPINLGSQEHRSGIDFELKYGGKISGNITDALTGLAIPNFLNIQFYNSNGEVAGGANVNFSTGDYTSSRAMPPGVYSARTGSMFSGDFGYDYYNNLYIMEKYDPAGNIDCPGVTCDLSTGNISVSTYDPSGVDPEGDATTSGIDFALDTGFSFSGTITDLSTSSPLERVHVLVYDDNGDFAHWASTDINGDFTVSGLPAGTYYAKTNNGSNLPFMGLRPPSVGTWVDILYNNLSCPGSACDVTTGTPIVLGSGSPDAGLSGAPQYSFSLPDGGTFTGRLTHSETIRGIPNTFVNIYNSQGEFFGGYESDIDGYWMTSGFPADTYYLVTQGRGAMVDVKFGNDYCFNGLCDPLTADPIVLGGTYHISGLNMVLKPDLIFRSGLE